MSGVRLAPHQIIHDTWELLLIMNAKNACRWLLACSCLIALNLQAEGLKRADVPANPAWILHVDCDRLRGTAVGKWILSELEKPEAQDKLAGLQAMFNFDPRTQLHAVTLYSPSSNPQDGVLVAYADFDPERLTTMAKSAREHESTTHGRYTIHSWVDENKKPKDGVQPRTYAAISGKRVLFGQKETSVAAALDVVDGTTPTLARSANLPQLGSGSSTSFVQAAARKMNVSTNDPNAAVFRLSKLLRLDIGEVQEKVNATLTLEAESNEIAGQISTVLQGVVALLKLQKEKPENVKIAEALSLRQEADNVVASLQLPASDVIEIVKTGMAKKAEKNNK